MYNTNILVIGNGIAGLSYALYVSEKFQFAAVTIVAKSKFSETNTAFAQGGIAAVHDPTNDSLEKHIADTLQAGDGHCNTAAVVATVREIPERIKDIAAYGVAFDKTEKQFHLALEGGHSAARVVHTADHTGMEIINKLMAKVRMAKNITVYEGFFACDLIVENNTCYGAWIHTGKGGIVPFIADSTMIACGGIGQIYHCTTNPVAATGDGIAMASRAGALISDMEFVQFHPTALAQTGQEQSFLISEAVRGAGAYLLNRSGERFMKNYDSRLELATRDIVSRAIRAELSRSGGEHVYLDCRHMDGKNFRAKFPHIYEKLKQSGIDPATDLIPVQPAAHYCCGGISTDLHGQTSIKHLLACGESAHTGLHGANRLASNSLAEALVFAKRAAASTHLSKHRNIITRIGSYTRHTVAWDAEKKNLLRRTMSGVAILSSESQLLRACQMVQNLRTAITQSRKKPEVRDMELDNMIQVGHLILLASVARTVNCGAFHKISDLVNTSDQAIY